MKLYRHIPNMITSLNLLSGSISIIFTFSGNYQCAAIMIFLAAVFDFMDGMAARALKAYSDIGKELDSLADVISFGLAPALMLYHTLSSIETIDPSIKFIPLIIVVFSALRLAKFNIDTNQKSNFMGLPTPACGLLAVSLIYFYAVSPDTAWIIRFIENSYTIPILSILLSYLLVSNIPMFSMKMTEFSWKKNRIRYIYLILVLIISVITLISGENWSLIVILAFTLYILLNFSIWVYSVFRQ